MSRRFIAPSGIALILLFPLFTASDAATIPAGWRGQYKLSGTAKLVESFNGHNDIYKAPVSRTMRAYAMKLDLGKTKYTFAGAVLTWQHGKLVPWKAKNGGYNVFANAPFTVTYEGDTYNFDGTLTGRLKQNSANKRVLNTKFKVTGKIGKYNVTVTIPLTGVQQ